MRILSLSDIHGHLEDLGFILAREAGDADLIVLAGDLTHKGGFGEAAQVLEQVLASGKPAVAVPGNMDTDGALQFLVHTGISLHGSHMEIGGIGFFGLGGSNPTPFHTPFEIEDQAASALLDAGYGGVRQCVRTVLVSHAPPRDTRLDRVATGGHFGSAAVRAFLGSHRVSLCISGHIHESMAEDRIGDTLCVNAGAVKDGHYMVIDLDENGIKATRRTI